MVTRVRGTSWAVALLALALIGGTSQRADAGPGTLTITGTMDVTQGVATTDNVAFSEVASFPQSDNLAGGGYTVYLATASFTVTGFGTSTPIPGAYAITIPYNVMDAYGAEIQGPPTISAFFNSVATFLVPPGDEETEYSDPLSPGTFAPFELSLVGGGTIEVDSIDSFTGATLLVPEPATLTLFGAGLMAMAPLRRRRQG